MPRTWIIDTKEKIEEEVLLKGWVNARRDMGKIIFIDLRDKSGLAQVVFLPQHKEMLTKAAELRPEFVVSVRGKINPRQLKQVNEKLATGKIEIEAIELEIINRAQTPVFEITKDTREVKEEARLKYRYLDLRTERMKKNLELRSEIIKYLINYLTKEKFTLIQTPILTKSTPEGARDYLVPSRVHKGKFFALPQSPQQYKQMLMVAGVERYFQIAPCFRDEDSRANRSPGEFYQLDMEMSFVTQNEILELVETMFTKMIVELFPQKHILQTPWPRLAYSEVMEKYKTDKPDLRKNKNDSNELAFAWIVNFPLFTPQTKEDYFFGAGEKLAPSHHMFTRPKEEDMSLLDTEPLKVRSYQHDLVLNGDEVGGGSIRIHEPELQEKIFDLIGFTKEDKQKFAHLLQAFTYGVPPHGGIAPGLDRLLATILGEKSIHEVIAFPLSSDVRDLLTNAPSPATPEQLKELGLKIM